MTSAPGHETPAAGPITVINVFEVPAEQAGNSIARWRARAEITGRRARVPDTRHTGPSPRRRASSW